MGTVFKPIVTRPLPAGARVVERDGKRIARWTTARGGVRTADVRTTPRGDCVAIESGKYLARYRDGQRVVRTVPTGCRDQMAARAVLAELERRSELVRSGIVTPAQDAMADHRRTTVTGHFQAYLESLRAKGTTPKHVATVARLLGALIAGCVFKTLSDIRREPVERWLANGPVSRRAARTRNTYLNAAKWFCNFCVDTERLAANPLARIPRADERADRRRQPRALTPDELERLLDAARRRPLAEALKFNRGWRKGQPGARLRPETQQKLELLGYERALAYRVMALTGLRLGELAAIRVRDVVLEDPQPHVLLEARHEKNREGSAIPLRPDLAADLRGWVQDRERESPLFRLSPNQVKVFDRDLRFAGIAKRDERGRVACVHSLRHSFGSLLARSSVPPRVAQAAMRHSTIDLTMQVYTDPKLLDVMGAIQVLPTLALAPVQHPHSTASPKNSDRELAMSVEPSFMKG